MMQFGLGKRQCLGEPLARAELFIIFVTCLQQFTFASPKNSGDISLEPVFGATALPRKYKMRVTKNT